MRKVVLVTGASSGVGLSLAKYLSGRFEVVAVARRIDKLKEELRSHPGITIRQADLSKTNDVLDLVAWLKSEFGHVPFVVNNAGVNLRGSIERLSLEQVNQCMAVNALAPFLVL